VLILFFDWSILTNKIKDDRFKALNIKTVLSDFCGQSLACELILALVSHWLLVNSFKETFKEKRPIDFFDYFIIFFSRYFDYFIIIIFEDILIILSLFCFFWFNRSYNVNDRLDFILIVIKQDYYTNDQLKFILSIIRRDNGFNVEASFMMNQDWFKEFWW